MVEIKKKNMTSLHSADLSTVLLESWNQLDAEYYLSLVKSLPQKKSPWSGKTSQ